VLSQHSLNESQAREGNDLTDDQSTVGKVLKFLSDLNDTQEADVLTLAANCFQVYGFVQPLIAGLVGESGPDNQDVLNAISALAQQLEVDFAELGNLILQQIQLVLKNENTIALADALAHTGTAMDHLTNWLRTKTASDLDAADNESDLGIQFFLALPVAGEDPGQASQTQPYFLPGIAKAGTVRVLTLMARDGTALWKVGADVNEVNAIIGLMEGMLASIETTVNAAHMVVWGRLPGSADPVEWGYFHEEHGTVLQYFNAGPLATNEAEFAQSQKLVARARTEADAARAAGVAAELAFIGVPDYQAIVDGQWKVAITSPTHRVDVGPGRLGTLHQ
jgi:hypothetical protein